MQSTVKFDNSSNREFAKVLNQRVTSYFKDKKMTRNANVPMVLRTIMVISFQLGLYLYMALGDYSIITSYIIWGLLGFGMVWTAVNVGHDAIHGAYSSNKFINKLLGHTFTLNGASVYMWDKMHNTAHHTYTNVKGLDEDVESLPILRLSPQTPFLKIHKHQYKFALFFYGLGTISWVFIKDYIKFFKNKVGNYNGRKHSIMAIIKLFFYKLIYYALFVVAPYYLADHIPWQHILGGFLLMHFIGGMYLALVFMLAHIVEKAHHPVPSEINELENSWLVHQLYTTANFGEESLFLSFMTGGLNTQVEHHLYPNMCTVHYRHISKIVKQTASEFNLPYYTYSGFWSALRSHVKFLKILGEPNPKFAGADA